MKKLVPLALSFVLCASPSLAQENVAPKWGAHIEAEGKWGTDRSLGEMGLFMPIWQDEDTLLFSDIRGRLDDQGSAEGNFGLGIRHEVTPQWAVGAYGFYDRRRTENGNMFNQATLGAEALGEKTEFRVNGYIPESTEKIASRTATTSSTASAAGGNFQLSTNTNTNTVNERALPGFDVEAGYKLDLAPDWDLWAYGGGFYFNADGYQKVSGPRGRVEVSRSNLPVFGTDAKFTLGFETQSDDVRGGQSFGIARLRIPLNATEKRAKHTRSALDDRMTTRIVRDIDIVSGSGTPTTTTSTTNETGNVSLGSGATVSTYTQLDATDDVVADITAAGAGSVILLDGSAGTINVTANINVQNNQTILGGGRSVTVTGATSGRTATLTLPGTRPTINQTGGPGQAAMRIDNDDNVVIDGLDITSDDIGIFTGLVGGAPDNLTIKNVNISNTFFQGMLTSRINGLTLENVSFTNISGGVHAAFQISAGASSSNFQFTNVTVDNASFAFWVQAGTINTVSGSITATNIGTANCRNDGTITGSTLQINSVLCN